MINTLCRLRPN